MEYGRLSDSNSFGKRILERMGVPRDYVSKITITSQPGKLVDVCVNFYITDKQLDQWEKEDDEGDEASARVSSESDISVSKEADA